MHLFQEGLFFLAVCSEPSLVTPPSCLPCHTKYLSLVGWKKATVPFVLGKKL
jgi:hypothetical protein